MVENLERAGVKGVKEARPALAEKVVTRVE